MWIWLLAALGIFFFLHCQIKLQIFIQDVSGRNHNKWTPLASMTLSPYTQSTKLKQKAKLLSQWDFNIVSTLHGMNFVVIHIYSSVIICHRAQIFLPLMMMMTIAIIDSSHLTYIDWFSLYLFHSIVAFVFKTFLADGANTTCPMSVDQTLSPRSDW